MEKETKSGIYYQHFYIPVNGQPRPHITICYIRTEDNCNVGVSICSLKDNPSKVKGRNIALSRAQAAQRGVKSNSSQINRQEALEVIRLVNKSLKSKGKETFLWRKFFTVSNPSYSCLSDVVDWAYV